MADEQPTSVAAAAGGQKRKRGPASPGDARKSKRGAPAAAMGDVESATADFSSEHAAALEYAALAAEHVGPAVSAADSAAASTAAAAALDSLYPTIHVPPTTEETFAAQADAAQGQSGVGDSSFGAGDLATVQSDLENTHVNILPAPSAPGQNGSGPATSAYAPTGPPPSQAPTKPAVGSAEWHRQRKENHKEGE